MDDNENMHADTESAVSMELLEEYTGGDREFLIELTDQFWLDLDDRMPELRASVTRFDGPTLKSVAHAIAGAATCVGAETLRTKALVLEECGGRCNVAAAAPALVEFEAELQRVRDFFAEYLA